MITKSFIYNERLTRSFVYGQLWGEVSADSCIVMPMCEKKFTKGYRIQDDDMNLRFMGRNNKAGVHITGIYSPYQLTYSVGKTDSGTGIFTPIGRTHRSPVKLATGVYRPNFIIGKSWHPGNYEVRWYCVDEEDSTVKNIIMPFTVVFDGYSSVLDNEDYRNSFRTVVVGGPYLSAD